MHCAYVLRYALRFCVALMLCSYASVAMLYRQWFLAQNTDSQHHSVSYTAQLHRIRENNLGGASYITKWEPYGVSSTTETNSY